MQLKRLFLFSLLSAAAYAQTSVTGTITDTDSNLWANAQVVVTFQTTPACPQTSGQTTFSTTANSSGAYSVTLPAACPSGASWNFATMAITTPGQRVSSFYSTVVAVSGGSQTVNLAPPGPRFSPGFGALFGYGTVEVDLPIRFGTQMQIVPGNTCQWYTLTGWTTCPGTGGGGATFPNTPSIVKNTSTTASIPAVLSDLTGLGAAPAASPTFTGTITTPVTGSTQCLHVNSAGVISGTSADCGTAITNAGVANQLGYYAATGTAISPDTFLNLANSTHVETATEGINTGQMVVTGNQPQVIDSSYPNAASGGSIPLFLNKLNTSGQVVEATTTDTAVALFVVASASDNGATVTSNGVTICGNGPSGTNANACIVHGKATLTFDSGGGTIGHYCIESTITNGTCHDSVNPSGISCAGLITQTAAASGTGVIDTTYCQPQSVSLGGTVNTSGTANLLSIYPSTGTTVGPDSLLSDSGTALAYTGTAGFSTPFLSATGTQSGTALGLKLGASSGLALNGGAIQTFLASTTTVSDALLAAGHRIPSGSYYCWSASGTGTTACDTALFRPSAGVVEVSNAATANALGTISAAVHNIGAAGTLGTAVFGNATSGTVTVEPVTGALGSVTVSLPATTGTVALTSQLDLSISPVALPTSSIGANTCTAATGSPFTATGVTTSMVVVPGFSSDPSAVTGYGSSGGLSVNAYPAANAVNVKVCNSTASPITPGALTVNIRIIQ